MRVSFNWLKDYVAFSLTPRQLAERLTMAGLEVEGLEDEGGDWALEINVTANRPDCLSIFGVAREVAAITRRALRPPKIALKQAGGAALDMISVEVADAALCPRYAGRVVAGVSVGASPAWMQTRLQAVGMRAINNVVDATNYVMMELGHPLHAFDCNLLSGRRIIVRAAGEGETLTTLDGVERRLEPGMLLIADGTRPVALAGVMGGGDTEVTLGTTDVFIESAYFDPVSVRRTSKRLGLHTEASHRFERGADPEGLIAALDRAASLIYEIAGGGAVSGRADVYPRPITMPEVPVDAGRVNALLGVRMEKKEMTDILKRLKITVADTGPDSFTAQAPAFRPDLTREADMAEEIARMHGYGRIKAAFPSCVMTPRAPDGTRGAVAKAKETLRSLGYSEAINYSFMDPADLDRLMLPEDDPRRKVLRLRNPLSAMQSVMRTTLVPGLLGNLAWNLSRGVGGLKLFEASRVFISAGPGLPEETLTLAAIAAGSRTGSLWDGPGGALDFFDMKGAVEALVGVFGVDGVVFKPAPDIPFLHPGKAAWLMTGGRRAGCLGQAHPEVAAAFGVAPESHLEAYIFELEFQALTQPGRGAPAFHPLPKYPAVERDVAAIVPDDVPAGGVQRVILSTGSGLIESVRLFDFYQGRPIPEGKKSLAYKITYRSPDRTLTDPEVNAAHRAVMDALKERLGAEIREQ